MKRVCIKLLLDDIEGLTKSELEVYIKREILVLKEIGTHPNITKLLGITINDNKILLVMEYASGGDLTKKLFDRNVDLNWEQRVQFAKDIANALLFLHSKNIVHRDLKPVNLLIKSPEDWTILTCDFGFARKIDNEEFMTICGSDSHMAPEIKLGQKYNSKADVYSYGIVLSELITRTPAKPRTNNEPFEADSFKQFAESLECPKPLLELVIECVNNDPEKRPDTSVIIKKLEQIIIKGEESSESDTLSDSEENKDNKEEESSKPKNPGEKTPRKKKAIKKRIKKKTKAPKKEDNEEGKEENETENPPKKTTSTKKTSKRISKSKTSKKAPGTLEKEIKGEDIVEVKKEDRVDIIENKSVKTETKDGKEKNNHKEEKTGIIEKVEKKIEEKIESKKEKHVTIDVVEENKVEKTPKVETKNVEEPIQNTLLEKTPQQGIKEESSKKSESTNERNRRRLLQMKSHERLDILKHKSDSEGNTSSENLKTKQTPTLTSTPSEMTITQRSKRPDRTPKKKTSSKMVTLTSVKGNTTDSKEELSFTEGTKIVMIELDHTGWIFGKANKKYGWFPLECVNFGGEKKPTSTPISTPKEDPKDIQKQNTETPSLSENVSTKEKKTKKKNKSGEKDTSNVLHVESTKEKKLETKEDEVEIKRKEIEENKVEVKEIVETKEVKVEVKEVEEKKFKEDKVEVQETKENKVEINETLETKDVKVKEVQEKKVEEKPKIEETKVVEKKESNVEIKENKMKEFHVELGVKEHKVEVKEVTEEKIEAEIKENKSKSSEEEKIEIKVKIKEEEITDHKHIHKHQKEEESSEEGDDDQTTEHSDSSDTDESEEKVAKEEKVVKEEKVDKVEEKVEIPKEVIVEKVIEEKVIEKESSPLKEERSGKKKSEGSSSEDTSSEEEKKSNFDKDLIKHAEGLEEGNKKISVFDAILSGVTTTKTVEPTEKEKEEDNIVWVSDFQVIEEKKKENVLKKRPEHTPKKKVSSKNLPMTSTKAYKSEEKEELSFAEGSKIFMIEIDPSGWVFGKHNKSYGWFPIECVDHNKGESTNYRGSLLISTPNSNNLENEKLNNRKSMFVSLANDGPLSPKGNETIENETKNIEISENKTLPVEENKQDTNTEKKEEVNIPTSFPPISSDEQLINKIIIQLRDLEGSLGKNKKMLTTFENSILAQKIVSHITSTCGGEKEALQLCQTLENRGVIEQSQKKKASKFSPKEFYQINMFRPELGHLNRAKQWEGETGNPLQISAEILRKLVTLVEKQKPKQITDIKSLKEFYDIDISTCVFQKSPLKDLDGQERMLFFINVRNILILHYQINKGCPKNLLERKDQAQAAYVIDGNIYTVDYIEETILKGTTPPNNTDPRRNNVSKFPTNILVFSLCDCTVSTPKPFWFVSSSSYRETLSENVSKFLQGEFGIDESYLHSNNKLELPKLLKGVFEPNEIVKNIKPYLSEKTRKLIEQIEKAVELDLSYKNSSFQSCFELK